MWLRGACFIERKVVVRGRFRARRVQHLAWYRQSHASASTDTPYTSVFFFNSLLACDLRPLHVRGVHSECNNGSICKPKCSLDDSQPSSDSWELAGHVPKNNIPIVALVFFFFLSLLVCDLSRS